MGCFSLLWRSQRLKIDNNNNPTTQGRQAQGLSPTANVPETPTAKGSLPKNLLKETRGNDWKPREAAELWNEAYNDLRNNDPTRSLTQQYERVLIRIDYKSGELLGESDTNIDTLDTGGDARMALIKAAVEKGLKHTQALEDAKEMVGDVLQVVLGVKDLVSSALTAFPPAAAAWTGISLVFEVSRT
jgi:hypothetical protein